MKHPLADGVAIGVALSLLAAAAAGWAVAYRVLGPPHKET